MKMFGGCWNIRALPQGLAEHIAAVPPGSSGVDRGGYFEFAAPPLEIAVQLPHSFELGSDKVLTVQSTEDLVQRGKAQQLSCGSGASAQTFQAFDVCRAAVLLHKGWPPQLVPVLDKSKRGEAAGSGAAAAAAGGSPAMAAPSGSGALPPRNQLIPCANQFKHWPVSSVGCLPRGGRRRACDRSQSGAPMTHAACLPGTCLPCLPARPWAVGMLPVFTMLPPSPSALLQSGSSEPELKGFEWAWLPTCGHAHPLGGRCNVPCIIGKLRGDSSKLVVRFPPGRRCFHLKGSKTGKQGGLMRSVVLFAAQTTLLRYSNKSLAGEAAARELVSGAALLSSNGMVGTTNRNTQAARSRALHAALLTRRGRPAAWRGRQHKRRCRACPQPLHTSGARRSERCAAALAQHLTPSRAQPAAQLNPQHNSMVRKLSSQSSHIHPHTPFSQDSAVPCPTLSYPRPTLNPPCTLPRLLAHGSPRPALSPLLLPAHAPLPGLSPCLPAVEP